MTTTTRPGPPADRIVDPRATRQALALGGMALVAACSLHLVGGGVLAPPPLTGVPAWIHDSDPAVVAMTLLRLLVLATCWYIVAGCGCALAAALVGRTLPLTRLVPPLLLRVGVGATTTGLAMGLIAPGMTRSGPGVVTVAAAPSQPPPSEPPPAEPLLPTTSAPTITASPPTTIGLASIESTQTPPPPILLPVVSTPALREAPVDSWTVRRGDHLWSIAEETLRDHWGRETTESETATYWRLVIDHNRDRLVDPDEPDLIHAGQVLLLPDPGPPVPAG